MFPVFKNVGERSTAKNYRPVSLLSVVSKVFEKLVNNRIVDHLEKCGLFSDFQYGFRSSRSTADHFCRSLNFTTDQKLFLPKKNIEMYSMYNEGKSVVCERFIRTLKNKICKYIST